MLLTQPACCDCWAAATLLCCAVAPLTPLNCKAGCADPPSSEASVMPGSQLSCCCWLCCDSPSTWLISCALDSKEEVGLALQADCCDCLGVVAELCSCWCVAMWECVPCAAIHRSLKVRVAPRDKDAMIGLGPSMVSRSAVSNKTCCNTLAKPTCTLTVPLIDSL